MDRRGIARHDVRMTAVPQPRTWARGPAPPLAGQAEGLARGGRDRRAGAPVHLARVGLADRSGDKVRRYSLGMRHLRVAQCLLADPLLLILDEPTNGLDPAGIQEFRQMIRAMVEQEGRTVFLSSHLLDEVEKICAVGRAGGDGAVADRSGRARRLADADDGRVRQGRWTARTGGRVRRGRCVTAPAGRPYVGGELSPHVGETVSHPAAVSASATKARCAGSRQTATIAPPEPV